LQGGGAKIQRTINVAWLVEVDRLPKNEKDEQGDSRKCQAVEAYFVCVYVYELKIAGDWE
jgi:hypothetical protein